jgi:hypothetical protein
MRGYIDPIIRKVLKNEEAKNEFYAVVNGYKQESSICVDGQMYRFKNDGNGTFMEKKNPSEEKLT